MLHLQIMQKCTVTFSNYRGYYYWVTPGSLIGQGLNVRKLMGSINCQNSCIHLLENNDMEDRAYSFKYISLFNWLIRTVKQDDWRDLYRIIQRQILDDKMNILCNEEINFKIKILLCICGISPLFAHAICKKVNQND